MFFFWKLAWDWLFFLSDVLEPYYHILRNQKMQLVYSCPLTGPGTTDAGLGMILSIAPLPTHQSSRVSTSYIQCNLSPPNTVSAIRPFPYFFFHIECLVQLAQVVLLDQDSNDKKTHCVEHYIVMSTKPHALKQYGLFRWNYIMTICLNLLHLFWRGLNPCNLHQTSTLCRVLWAKVVILSEGRVD